MTRIVVLNQATTHPRYTSVDHLSRTTWGRTAHPGVRIIHYYGAYDANNMPISRFSALPDTRSSRLLDEDTLVCGVNDHLGPYVDPRGERFILALEYCVAHLEFDYIYRTTNTSYIDIGRMYEFFEAFRGRERLYDGARNRHNHENDFVSGFHVMMSRDVIVEMVRHKREFLALQYPEDVATGILILQTLRCAHQFEEVPFESTTVMAYEDHFRPEAYLNSRVFNYRFRRDGPEKYLRHHAFLTTRGGARPPAVQPGTRMAMRLYPEASIEGEVETNDAHLS